MGQIEISSSSSAMANQVGHNDQNGMLVPLQNIPRRRNLPRSPPQNPRRGNSPRGRSPRLIIRIPDDHEGQDNEEIFQRYIEKVQIYANVLYFIVKALRFAKKAIYMLIFVILVITEGNVAGSLKMVLPECTSKEDVLCYSEIMKNFFPISKMVYSPRLSIAISSSGLSNSAIIYESGFPLSVYNLYIWVAAFSLVVVLTWIMTYFHKSLVEIEETTTAIHNNQVLRRRLAPRPDIN